MSARFFLLNQKICISLLMYHRVFDELGKESIYYWFLNYNFAVCVQFIKVLYFAR